MNMIDVFLGVFLLLGLVRGFQKGFILQVASLVALILGVYCSVEFSHIAASYLKELFVISSQVATLLSFVVTFASVIVAVHLLAKLIEGMFKLVAMGFVNRLAGAFFGLIKMAMISSVLLSVLYHFEGTVQFIDSETKSNSILYQHIRKLAPSVIPSIRNLVEEKREDWLVCNCSNTRKNLALKVFQ